MFYYFGYGSNISMRSLKAKGVVPISSQQATLIGWRLRFNVQHFFRHEGGVGNIEYTGNQKDRVLGMLHLCSDEALPLLDAAEAKGYGYDRVTLDVCVESPDDSASSIMQAVSYIGTEEFINNSCLPSQRYLNIIVSGAKEAKLDVNYIANIAAHPVLSPPEYPAFSAPKGEYPSFNYQSLKEFSTYTALSGHVFDMAVARPQHEFLKGFFGGRDMTLFHLQRMDSSQQEETLQDIKSGNLTAAQRRYLNSFLNEYAVEYQYVGHYNY